MASPPFADVHLEIVEETTDAGEEPHQVWHRQMASLSMGQHKQGLLAHSRQLGTRPSHRGRGAPQGWL